MLIYDCCFTGTVGQVRKNNEDNFYLNGCYREDVDTPSFHVRERCKEGTFAVFDGMGGTECGEEASLRAAEALLPYGNILTQEHFEEYIRRANKSICSWRRENHDAPCGTTVALLSLGEDRAICCNLGDSRIYLMRNGTLRQLSQEHTLSALMVRMGIYEDESCAEVRERHTLTRYLGAYEEESNLSIYCAEPFAVEAEDIFLLCSDGLTDMVDESEILKFLRSGGSAEEMAIALRDAALANGGRDNVTVGIIHRRTA